MSRSCPGRWLDRSASGACSAQRGRFAGLPLTRRSREDGHAADRTAYSGPDRELPLGLDLLQPLGQLLGELVQFAPASDDRNKPDPGGAPLRGPSLSRAGRVLSARMEAEQAEVAVRRVAIEVTYLTPRRGLRLIFDT
ncbi:hypothetical protein GCM10010319_34700 [Streptomyces blastmyceticus]|uniref:Uncharacterized protein n=1 Tax=Streptomyces blastmyceticus TaxID=68180 RepID=A0ABP3GWI1_9ACTN